MPYFLTCTIVNWIPVFTNSAIVKILFDSLKFLQARNRIKIFAYVVMENHVHLIASSDQLSKEIGIFKSFTARKILDFLIEMNNQFMLDQFRFHKAKHKVDREFQLWQEGSHPKEIQSHEMMIQKIKYIHNNPVRRGYIDEPVYWNYSSAKNYAGIEGMLEIAKYEI